MEWRSGEEWEGIKVCSGLFKFFRWEELGRMGSGVGGGGGEVFSLFFFMCVMIIRLLQLSIFIYYYNDNIKSILLYTYDYLT